MKLTFKRCLSVSSLSRENLRTLLSLIYETDPYIYPGITENQEVFAGIFTQLLQQDGPFSLGNFELAFLGGRLVGMALLFTDRTPDFHEEVTGTEGTSFVLVRDTVFSPIIKKPIPSDVVYINNLCVAPAFRNAQVAHRLLQHLIASYPTKKLELLCLRDNPAALRLYEDCGFRKTQDVVGFGHRKDGGAVPVIEMFRFPS